MKRSSILLLLCLVACLADGIAYRVDLLMRPCVHESETDIPEGAVHDPPDQHNDLPPEAPQTCPAHRFAP